MTRRRTTISQGHAASNLVPRMGDERLIRDTAALLARRGKVSPRVAERRDLVAEVRNRLDGAPLDPLHLQRVTETGGRERVVHVTRGVDRVVEAVAHHVLRDALRVVAVGPRTVHEELATFMEVAATAEFGVRTDITAAFDSVPRRPTFAVLGALVRDLRAVALVQRLVERHPGDCGIPTGSALSPLLLEVALVEPEAELAPCVQGVARYADDFAIAATDATSAAGHVALLSRTLGRFGFSLNPRKTGVHDLADGVPFLGHVIRRVQGRVRAYADPRTVHQFIAREAARHARELGPHPDHQREEVRRVERERRLAGLRSFFRLADQPSLELMLQGLASPVPET